MNISNKATFVIVLLLLTAYLILTVEFNHLAKQDFKKFDNSIINDKVCIIYYSKGILNIKTCKNIEFSFRPDDKKFRTARPTDSTLVEILKKGDLIKKRVKSDTLYVIKNGISIPYGFYTAGRTN